MQIKTLEELIIEVKKNKSKKNIVIASAADEFVLQAVSDFQKISRLNAILVGNGDEITRTMTDHGITLREYEIYPAENDVESAKASVQLIREGKGDMLMKGLLSTKTFIKEILNKRTGINKSGYFSHVGIFESPNYTKLFGITDAAINITPDLETKKHIIKNAVRVFLKLGIDMPKVALLAPIEKVNPKMQSTVDAAKLVEIHRSEPIEQCEIEGPMALDIAISAVAAEHKGVDSKIAGKVDILVVPEITSGNVLYKSLTYMGDARAAGILIGADVPVVLTSRTDLPESKLYSLALGNNLCKRN
ncbi:MAG: bifunctional enoyl-CoA hydratase/phosphate acetyltransferase [Bacteroidales bacterium]|jgi:phosphate butyryltransferase